MIIEKTVLIIFNEDEERARLQRELPEGSRLQTILIRHLDMIVAGEFDKAFELIQMLRTEERNQMHHAVRSIMDDIRARRKLKYTNSKLNGIRCADYPQLQVIQTLSKKEKVA